MATFMDVHSGFVGVTAAAAPRGARAGPGDRARRGRPFRACLARPGVGQGLLPLDRPEPGERHADPRARGPSHAPRSTNSRSRCPEHDPSRPRTVRLRGIIVGGVAVSALLLLAGQSVAIGAGQGELAAVRRRPTVPRPQGRRRTPATARSTSAPTRTAALGAMGQHYVDGDLVGDGEINPLTPEALVYRADAGRRPAPRRRRVRRLQGRLGQEPRPELAAAVQPARSRDPGRQPLRPARDSTSSTPGSGGRTRAACSRTGTRVTCRGNGDPA